MQACFSSPRVVDDSLNFSIPWNEADELIIE